MKEKTVFDKIYQKELDLKLKNLTQVNVAENTSLVDDKEELSNFNIKDASDKNLDALLNLLYNGRDFDKITIPSDFEKEALGEKVLRNRIKAEKIREELDELEGEILEEVKGSTFTLDISKSTHYKKASNDIFGGNKQRITYEDYLYLLDLKEKIIIHEAADILES
jgi:hypothetical protein